MCAFPSMNMRLCFINPWVEKKWNYDTIYDNLGWAEQTSVDWRNFCSRVMGNWLCNQDPTGGEDIVVKIDKSCFGEQKYRHGREPGNICVVGGIEMKLKKCFLIPLVYPLSPNRNKETLVPLTKNYILLGTHHL